MIFNPKKRNKRLRIVTLCKEKTNTQTKNIIRVRNEEVITKLFIIAHHYIKSLEKKRKNGKIMFTEMLQWQETVNGI